MYKKLKKPILILKIHASGGVAEKIVVKNVLKHFLQTKL